ncbi:MAG: hypothetical protein ACLQOO_22555 [Terriglobia bacterium]
MGVKIIKARAVSKRINVALSEDTVRTIDRIVKPRERSRFIQRAVQHYVTTASSEALQEQLKEAALRDRDLDLEIASDWFAVDQEQWQQLGKQEKQSRSTTRSEARSNGA